jgi:N-acetylglucosaminyldiphosphoundecaprenol N-acetyl-beta-D-mannosaminyltransferase
VSPYGVRSQVGIAHADEFEVDAEYAARASNREALGLLLRAMLGRLLGGNDETLERPAEVSIFGIPMINTSMDAAVEWILEVSEPGQSARQVAFVNPDCLNIAWRNPGYKRVLCSADRVFPDGIGIRIGGRMLGWGLRDNVNGTDLFPLLCESATAAGRALYLLGARPGVAAGAAASMQQRFPRLRIAGCRDGYFSPDEEPDVVAEINASGAAILLVALGAPRQELWIAERLAGLQVPVAMGVGGLFDFYSGRIRRAPIWMREIGLEWVYRIMQEPGRMWRRYIIGNPVFLYRVWIQKRHPERFEASDESQPS